MPDCTILGEGWVLDETTQSCVYTAPTMESTVFDPGEALVGSTWETGYERFFDPYEFTKETMLTEGVAMDISQLQEAWDLTSKQYSGEYQAQIGNIFGKASSNVMDLLSSWGGGGQTMTGRKKRQRDLYGREVTRGAEKFRLELGQKREAGILTLAEESTDLYQALETGIFDTREDWEKEQRSTLNALLTSGIFPEPETGGGWVEGDCVTNCADDCQKTVPCQPGQAPGGIYFTTDNCCEGSGDDDDTVIDFTNCPDCSCTTNLAGEQSCIDNCTGMEIAGSNC